jgi:hypothetical protein
MESNIKNQQSSGADLHLSEPHFDEEATLLSARPVVPIRDVRPEAHSGRRFALGLAMTISLIFGALGATLIYRQRGPKQATGIVETATQVSESKAQPLSGAGGAISEPPVSAPSVSEDLNDLATREVRSAGDITQPRKAARLSSPSAESGRANDNRQSAADNRRDQAAMRRAERMEARRLRREAEREAKRDGRGHKGQSSSDLLRIREIFEGSPRP